LRLSRLNTQCKLVGCEFSLTLQYYYMTNAITDMYRSMVFSFTLQIGSYSTQASKLTLSSATRSNTSNNNKTTNNLNSSGTTMSGYYFSYTD